MADSQQDMHKYGRHVAIRNKNICGASMERIQLRHNLRDLVNEFTSGCKTVVHSFLMVYAITIKLLKSQLHFNR